MANLPDRLTQRERKPCKCGCGQLTSGKINPDTQKASDYVWGHNRKGEKLGKPSPLKGKKRPPFSKEWREKIGKAGLGRTPWNKGKRLSKEHRKKLSEFLKKTPLNYWLGKKRPPFNKKWCKNMARNPWNKGKKFPEFSGKNHPFWKGTTPLKERVRKSFEYRQWRSDVFSRDFFACQTCGYTGKGIQAHHLKEFSIIWEINKIKTHEDAINCEELWNINNGITLCKKCHYGNNH